MTSLQISKILPCSEVNGPGKRFALWVQGCRGVPQLAPSSSPLGGEGRVRGMVRHCHGCWNRHTWTQSAGEVVSIDEVFAQVQKAVREYQVEGITISGGEPFQQAVALAELAKRCKEQGLNVVIFTGYTHEFLISKQAPDGAGELLKSVDLLVDGPYTASLRATDLPLRGSWNQRLAPFSRIGEQLAARVTDELPVVEFNFTTGEAAVTGFPV